ncbi:MAG: nitroreductase family deazaflavin-dependent oxidoreductase [Chloroflexota bacterium]|nr:nitroreductase family deazaflavin-dependent oxidoreductase [Chloroflexota bacterium]
MASDGKAEQANVTRSVKPISETKPPKFIFKYLANPILKQVLRSRRAKIGDMILLLTFTGRKSGRQFTTPIGYRRVGDKTLVLFTDSPWYKNLLGGAPVTLMLKGREMSGWAVASNDTEQIVRETVEHLRSHGLQGAREIGIMNLKFMPTEDELRVMLRDRAKITIEPK